MDLDVELRLLEVGDVVRHLMAVQRDPPDHTFATVAAEVRALPNGFARDALVVAIWMLNQSELGR